MLGKCWNRSCQNWLSPPIGSHGKNLLCQPKTAEWAENGRICLKWPYLPKMTVSCRICDSSYIIMTVSAENGCVCRNNSVCWNRLCWLEMAESAKTACISRKQPYPPKSTLHYKNGGINQNRHWCIECMIYCQFQQRLMADVVAKQDQILCTNRYSCFGLIGAKSEICLFQHNLVWFPDLQYKMYQLRIILQESKVETWYFSNSGYADHNQFLKNVSGKSQRQAYGYIFMNM